MTEDHRCSNCRYWFHSEKVSGPNGFCRRMPPTVLLLGVNEEPPEPPRILGAPGKPGGLTPLTQTFHPQTPPMAWCGEHQRRKEPRPA